MVIAMSALITAAAPRVRASVRAMQILKLLLGRRQLLAPLVTRASMDSTLSRRGVAHNVPRTAQHAPRAATAAGTVKQIGPKQTAALVHRGVSLQMVIAMSALITAAAPRVRASVRAMQILRLLLGQRQLLAPFVTAAPAGIRAVAARARI